MPFVRLTPLLLLAGFLGGCNMVVLDPSGDVAAQQRNLIYIATGLMLLVIIPVMVLTVVFAIRYRASSAKARYEPEWDHSTQIELAVWAVPLLIIIALGAFTWADTHLLDPYRPLGRIDHATPLAEEVEPLEVEVVSLDWKWLFILPQYGIASVNELAAPVDRPISFKLTSTSVMNAFFVPALAGMIYTMPGMETTLHGVINAPGEYEGFSSNYSGAGFSKMRFAFHGVDEAGFDAWVQKARDSEATLDRATYLALERPSEGVPVELYNGVAENLFDLIVNMCVDPGKMCMSEMMAIDARGGLGLAGIHNTLPLTYDKFARRGTAVFGNEPSYVQSLCTKEEAMAGLVERDGAPMRDRFTPLAGRGLPRPGPSAMTPIRTSSLPDLLKNL
ncbi:ubiquinol oxidase subunit II [Acuticoccus mangrovi]|uniref:Ubiquinol oxidase polypeptide II n=1 Tax=Acuticoccus mangrovi TaxID=2796142 RepID=A0A934IRW9_9HYPH|nr:ubiquinol oxidase subunit II [Acuticoccus mangrovi]MBJ3777545.1 ubiquinol oxidase subunit II [Acuticoccus mangrovi]